MRLFSIYDIKSETYGLPFCVNNKAVAIRMFSDHVNSTSGDLISKHPSDFKLVELASFDQFSGLISDISVISVGFGTDFVKSE